jgi:hypothetical protein
MKMDNEDRLLKVLDIVTDWFRFAESKNGALIAFNGASIYGLTNAAVMDFIKSSPLLYDYVVVVFMLLGASVVASLLSFVPSLKLVAPKTLMGAGESNSLFFQHLRGQSEVAIIQSICESDQTEFSRFEMDIANRIRHYSIITSTKYAYFTVAVWITLAAYITPVVAGILAIYWYRRQKRA